MATPEQLTNCSIEGILINHDFTWMPRNMEDCPCMECQDFLDREEALDRRAINRTLVHRHSVSSANV